MVEKFTGQRKKGEHEAKITNKEPLLKEYRGDTTIIPPKKKNRDQ